MNKLLILIEDFAVRESEPSRVAIWQQTDGKCGMPLT